MTFSATSRSLLAALALSTAVPALAAPPADLKEKAESTLAEAYPADGPGAAVIIVDDGKTVFAGGRGLADVEAKRPITPETVFRLGSITKQFSAAVVMQLVQEGRLSLDDKVSKFIPDYPEPGASATVRQLLNHTVGIQSYTGIPGWMGSDKPATAFTTDALIAEFRDMPSPSKPGEKWDYNNSGYVLVGAVIEKVTGKPWHEAVAERIAGPLGLATIRYGVGEESIPHMAKGYQQGEKGVEPSRPIHMSVPHAAGALVGNVGDLARWAQALHHGKVVNAESYKAMTSPTPLPDGKSHPYGFGLGLDDVRGRPSIGHGGGIFGFSTNSIYIPEEDLFVAVFANSDDPETSPGLVALRLAALALGDPFPTFEAAEVDPASLAPLLGLYKVEGDEAERVFFERDGQLYTRRGEGPESKVWAAGGDRFFYGKDSLTWFEVKRDAAGRPVMEMHQNGAAAAEKAVRAGPVPTEPVVEVAEATLQSYVGEYQMGPGSAAIARDEAGGLTIRIGTQPALAMRAKSASEFRVPQVGARVVFESEGDKVSGLVVHHNGREMKAPRVQPEG